MKVPKLCECGCKSPAPIAKKTSARLGHIKGQPQRFIIGHAARGRVSRDRKSADAKRDVRRIIQKRWRASNPEHANGQAREYKKRHPERVAASNRRCHLKKKFKMTEAEYEAMLDRQGGVCAISGRPPGKRRLAIDHDHRTGRNRGLLDPRINVALGLFEDNPEMIEAAARYLRAYA